MWCENTSFQFPLFHPEYCVFLLLGSSWTILFIHDRINSLADATVPPPSTLCPAPLPPCRIRVAPVPAHPQLTSQSGELWWRVRRGKRLRLCAGA